MDDLAFNAVQAARRISAGSDNTDPLSSVRTLILNSLPAADEPLGQAAHHHFMDPGKMLRAGLALSTGKAFGISTGASVNWAAAIEVLHNASLIHDDISDGDSVRRDRPSIWAAFGRDTALALGDWLIALSFEFAAKAAIAGNNPTLVANLSHHMKDTTTGQAMEFETTGYPDWSCYRQIIRGKTAPLFIAPVEGMALLAGRQDIVEPITQYFNAVGTAYQVANDILNILGSDGAINPASDLVRRAPNGVIVTYRNLLVGKEAKEFDTWLLSGDQSAVAKWHHRLLQSSAIKVTTELMNGILRDAENKATCVPDELSHIVRPIQKLLTSICALSLEHAAE